MSVCDSWVKLWKCLNENLCILPLGLFHKYSIVLSVGLTGSVLAYFFYVGVWKGSVLNGSMPHFTNPITLLYVEVLMRRHMRAILFRPDDALVTTDLVQRKLAMMFS